MAAAAVACRRVEAAGGLVPSARDRLGALLRGRAAEGAAVVVATHDPRFVAAWCDAVVTLGGPAAEEAG